MSIPRRRIDVTITLGTGNFGADKGDTVTLTGLRVMASIAAYAGATQGALQARIFGMPLELMQQLTVLGSIASTVRGANKVQIAAGDDGSALTAIYEGTIDSAFGDFNSTPDVAFNITALSALTAAMKPVGATSYKGATSVETIMRDLATSAGYAFENYNVDATLASPYFPGPIWQQIQSCARAANINYTVDRNTLIIWQKGAARAPDTEIIVGPDTGMVGYPTFSSQGLLLSSIFQPNANIGGVANVKSLIQPANGRWTIFGVNHELQSEMPGGSWFTNLQLSPYVRQQ